MPLNSAARVEMKFAARVVSSGLVKKENRKQSLALHPDEYTRMPELNWSCRYFDELTPRQLYEILRLRSEVFVLEQECLYQDLDNYDQGAWHLMGSKGDALMCYARLLPPTIKYSEPSIGRVICAISARSKGYGKQLMQKSIEYSDRYWPGLGIRISAQQRLEQFYQGFEFETSSDTYLEDGIPHVEMLRKPVSPI